MNLRAVEAKDNDLRTDNIWIVDRDLNFLYQFPTFRVAGSSDKVLPQPLRLVVDDASEVEAVKQRVFDVWGIPIESRPK